MMRRVQQLAAGLKSLQLSPKDMEPVTAVQPGLILSQTHFKFSFR